MSASIQRQSLISDVREFNVTMMLSATQIFVLRIPVQVSLAVTQIHFISTDAQALYATWTLTVLQAFAWVVPAARKRLVQLQTLHIIISVKASIAWVILNAKRLFPVFSHALVAHAVLIRHARPLL